MKNLKYLIGAASVLIVASFASGSALAANTVSTTPHNLANLSTTPASTEICAFCHTPHGGATTAPLWNRSVLGVGFTLYSNPGNTIDGTIGQPTGVSAGCLSCHDGATAMDSTTIAVAFTPDGTKLAAGKTMSDLVTPTNANANLGTSLANDHPVSIEYGTVSGDAAFDTVVNARAAGVVLYGAAGAETVECGSCHNPHDNDDVGTNDAKFLRFPNTASAMCVACHTK